MSKPEKGLASPLLSTLSNIEHGFLFSKETRASNFAHVKQVHGDSVLTFLDGMSTETPLGEADAIFTETTNPVAIQTADCLPVLFSTKDGSKVAAAHAGWRGLAKGVLSKTAEKFIEGKVSPKELLISIGPAIGPCCFEVGLEVISEFEDKWGHLWKNFRKPYSRKKRKLNLAEIALLQLSSLRIPRLQIENLNICTYCSQHPFESFRRATHKNTQAGRQWSFIQRR